MDLQSWWFILIAVLWTGYLFLEGFDLGIGMHMHLLARDERERRTLLNTIGPVWDGNEVWLITAAGATFAAFPLWYASLLSALYLPLLLVLAGLIFRATAIEYRGKMDSDRWRRNWTLGMSLGSLVAAFGIGAGLALTTTGLPLNENGDRVGGAFAWLNGYAILGGLAVAGFALVHGAAFLMLKTDGEIRQRARAFLVRALPALLLPLAAWVLVVQLDNGKTWTWLPIALSLGAGAVAWISALTGQEKAAFGGLAVFLLAGVVAIFGSAYPTVLPSTENAAWDLTVHTASSSPYTLKVMTVVAAFGVPLVLAYQAWTYWVFRQRLHVDAIPEPHDVASLASGGH